MDGNELAMEMEATYSKYVLNYGNMLKEMSFITVRKFINQGPDRNKTNKDLSFLGIIIQHKLKEMSLC